MASIHCFLLTSEIACSRTGLHLWKNNTKKLETNCNEINKASCWSCEFSPVSIKCLHIAVQELNMFVQRRCKNLSFQVHWPFSGPTQTFVISALRRVNKQPWEWINITGSPFICLNVKAEAFIDGVRFTAYAGLQCEMSCGLRTKKRDKCRRKGMTFQKEIIVSVIILHLFGSCLLFHWHHNE